MLHDTLLSTACIIGVSTASPTLVVKTENCLYIYIFIYLCMWYVRFPYIYIPYIYIPYIYIHLAPFVLYYISTLHVGSCNHCCSREKTNRTQRLNSGNQRNRDLKTVMKGRQYYQADY